MDTNLIFQFRSVFEAGTIVRAAEQLSMTAGALSRAMKRLEDVLGCKLFTPSGRNILPTHEAKLFYISSQEIIGSIENAKKSIKQQKQSEKELKIATFEVFSTHFMAWMIQNQSIQFPVTLFEATPGLIEKNILNGLADFGLTYIPELNPELDHLLLGEMPLGVFVSQKSKNKELPYAVPITELGINHLQAKSLDGWPNDFPRKIQYKFEMLETALDLTTRGMAKILCPKFIVKIENERLNEKHKLVEEDQKIRFPKMKVFAVKKKTHPENEYFKKLCKAVRLVLQT
ncbi:MAG: LysR family transcriptional regulator [Bacteriovoracaceae bacterium]|nr:LysR family transcriptional regulator [Bacteriovoracaceae bacterium]